MVRATAARVLVRLGTYPTGITEAMVTAMCTSADYVVDGFTYPDSLGTDNNAIEVCVDIVLNMIEERFWFQAGGLLTGQPRPTILTEELKERIRSLQTDPTTKGYGVVKMQGDS